MIPHYKLTLLSFAFSITYLHIYMYVTSGDGRMNGGGI